MKRSPPFARYGTEALLLLPILTPSALAQPVRERVSIGVVTISIEARTSSGKPAQGLNLADFSLRVDGQPVRIDSFSVMSPALAGTSQPADARQARAATPEDSASTVASAARDPLHLGILIDEGSTAGLDRPDVYRQLDRFLHDAGPTSRRFLIARFSGANLRVVCPWTEDLQSVYSAMNEISTRPRAPSFVSPWEIPGLSRVEKESLQKEIIPARDRLFRSILTMVAAFPPVPARRMLVLVSSGTALISPPDLAAMISGTGGTSGSESRGFRERLEDPQYQLEQNQRAFQLWSSAQRQDWYGAMRDLIAKAQEKGVAFVPIEAEAYERGTNPGAESKWGLRPMSGVSRGSIPANLGLAPRLAVSQTMTTMAVETGGEPILLPLKTGDQLERLQALEPYLLTFRDPFGDDHRRHRVEIQTNRPGITLTYRRGYRVPSEEEEILDGLMVRLAGTAPVENPLSVEATVSPGAKSTNTAELHVDCRYQPLPEHGLEVQQERPVTILVAAKDASGNQTDPAKWVGAAHRLGTTTTFAADFDVQIPAKPYRWSIAVQDSLTGVVSYLITESER